MTLEVTEWNITTGCERLTPGCDNCPTYWDAKERGLDYHPRFYPKRLGIPTANEIPTAYMVSAGSDLFHEAIRVEEIEAVFNVMARATQHHFEVITKRIERMETLSARHLTWPSNVMAGVTIEEAKYKWRLDCLRGIDARRFVSFGPMTGRVGKVDLTGIEVAGVVVEQWGKPRPVKQKWVDEIHKQCDASNVRIARQHWLTQGAA